MNLGTRGERQAARFLKRAGLRILRRNYRCPAGEIDLVAADHDTLVFVEVKTRQSGDATDPENNVTLHKRRKITATARYFLQQYNAANQPCRFDVVSVLTPQRGPVAIEHFVDAFAPQVGRRANR